MVVPPSHVKSRRSGIARPAAPPTTGHCRVRAKRIRIVGWRSSRFAVHIGVTDVERCGSGRRVAKRPTDQHLVTAHESRKSSVRVGRCICFIGRCCV
jgi:hypothetical protein